MLFPSLTFLLFLVIVFALYWAFPRRGIQNMIVLVASYVFYGWWDPRFCLLMLASSLIDYVVGLLLGKHDDARIRKLLITISIVANLGLLGFFKYFGFFVDSAVDFLTALGFQVFRPTLEIILPVGISFYTFQTMSYSIDIYRRQLPASRDLVGYLAYVSFFPQLVAGPIERASNLLPQFANDRRFDPASAADGLRQMLWGFFKKMVIADHLGALLYNQFASPEQFSGAQLLLASMLFAFQLYNDFSGYSDIAVGTAKLFGINLMQNFRTPYFSRNPGEFWRRWHVSLSTWFRDYVYIPLGGSRVATRRLLVNVMVTFTLSGIWHGAAWTYILWGVVNGLLVLPFALRHKGASAGREGLRDIPAILVTFVLMSLTFAIFRATDLSQAMTMLGRIITFAAAPTVGAGEMLAAPIPTALVLGLLAGQILIEWIQRLRPHPLQIDGLPRFVRWTVYTVLFWSIITLGTYNTVQFVYFEF